MRPSTTIALLSTIALLEFSFGHPLSSSSTGQDIHDLPHHAHRPHHVADAQVPPAQAVAMIPAPIHSSEPLPRRLSRRTDGYLPTGHRPADLGANNSMVPANGISTIPKQRSLQMAERKDPPIMKRHDHIDSPEAVTAASCNVGEAQCCQSIHQSQEPKAQFLTSLLGIASPLDNSMVGVQCTPIANLLSVVGGSSTCNSKPVCCTGNEYHGLVNIGCSPISA